MSKTLRLRIVTPDETLLDEDVTSVRFEGLDGGYGILPNHAPLVTATVPSVLSYQKADGGSGDIVIAEGFAEMLDNTLSIIAEAGEDAAGIDAARAHAEVERAKEHLATLDKRSMEADRAAAQLRRALARQLAAQRRGGSSDIAS